MLEYTDTVRIYTDDLVDIPSDTLSEAVYNNTKLNYLFKSTDEYDEDTDLSENQSVGIDEEHEEYQDNKERNVLANRDDYNDKESTYDQNGAANSEWRLKRVIAGAHQGWVRSVSVDPVTNRWFVTGSSDATIKIWDLASSDLKSTLTGHIMGVRALEISSKFPYLFSGSEDKTVRCWDLERTNSSSGSQIRDYHGHVGGIYAMALHPELDLLMTGGKDAVVRVWDIRSRTEVMVLTGHRNDITSIIAQNSDPQIITSSMDSTIRFWDLRKQNTELTLTQHNKSIRSMKMHPNESTVCSGDSGGNLKQWVIPSGELLNEFGARSDNKIINTLSINGPSNTLFAGYDDGKLEFYDYISGKLQQTSHSKPLPGSTEPTIYASTFDNSGLRLLTCEGDKSIKIWGNDT